MMPNYVNQPSSPTVNCCVFNCFNGSSSVTSTRPPVDAAVASCMQHLHPLHSRMAANSGMHAAAAACYSSLPCNDEKDMTTSDGGISLSIFRKKMAAKLVAAKVFGHKTNRTHMSEE